VSLLPAVPGFFGAWGQAALVVFGLLTLLWVVSVIRDDVSIIDVAWGPAYLGALLPVAFDGELEPRTVVLLCIVAAWSIRLAVHLAPRVREPEDYRYAEMRKRNGPAFRWTSLVRVFWLQAALATLFSTPLVAAALVGGSPGVLGWAGAALAMAGLVFEAVADAQLAAFKADPASGGRVLDSGLWRYSRHPNYFGEATVWWGFGLFCADALAHPIPFVVSLLMTLLLLRVSGVPLLESHLESTRPGYAEYARRTSAFVPLPPRTGEAE
jgi:steroid 5-alpha reductase family enzyme